MDCVFGTAVGRCVLNEVAMKSEGTDKLGELGTANITSIFIPLLPVKFCGLVMNERLTLGLLLH